MRLNLEIVVWQNEHKVLLLAFTGDSNYISQSLLAHQSWIMGRQLSKSADKDGAMQLKGPEKASKWTLCLDIIVYPFFSVFISQQHSFQAFDHHGLNATARQKKWVHGWVEAEWLVQTWEDVGMMILEKLVEFHWCEQNQVTMI